MTEIERKLLDLEDENERLKRELEEEDEESEDDSEKELEASTERIPANVYDPYRTGLSSELAFLKGLLFFTLISALAIGAWYEGGAPGMDWIKSKIQKAPAVEPAKTVGISIGDPGSANYYASFMYWRNGAQAMASIGFSSTRPPSIRDAIQNALRSTESTNVLIISIIEMAP